MNIPVIVFICIACFRVASSLYTGEYSTALWAGLAAIWAGMHLHECQTSRIHREGNP